MKTLTLRKILFITMLAILLQACATTYHALNYTGGYSDIQLDNNAFKVNFDSNGYTDTNRTADFALLHSAELTLQHGYKYFIITDSKNDIRYSTHTTPRTENTTGHVNTNGNFHAQTTVSGGKTYTVSKPSSMIIITCFKEKPQSGTVFNAKMLIASITKKYNIHLPSK